MSKTKGVKLDDTTEQRLAARVLEEKYEQEKREDMERWERYQLTGDAVSHEKATEWIENLAQGKVTTCPK